MNILTQADDDKHKNMYINILPFKKKEIPIEKIVDEEIRCICKPDLFEDYVKCFGLSKGTGIWEDNMKELLSDGTVDLKNVIANREDAYELLINAGMEKTQAFRITEDIRKGMANRCGWDEKTRDIIESKEEYQSVDVDTVDLINAYTDSKISKKEAKGGKVNMCTAIQGLIEDGRVKGRAEGENKAFELIKLLKPGTKEYDKALNGTAADRQRLYKKYNIISG